MASSLTGMAPYGSRSGGAIGNTQTGAAQVQGNVIPKGYKYGQIQQFTPEQMDLWASLFPYLSENSSLSRAAQGDESYFSDIEKPAMRQLGQLQGQLASRFSGASGTGQFGGRNSSAHMNAQGSLAQEFAEKMKSQRHDLSRQALNDLFNLSNQLMSQRPYDRFLVEEKEDMPFWKQFLLGITGGASQGIGSGIGSGISSGFNRLWGR